MPQPAKTRELFATCEIRRRLSGGEGRQSRRQSHDADGWHHRLKIHVKLTPDAVCSGVDKAHDASLALLNARFSAQLTTLRTREVLDLIADQPTSFHL